MVKCSVMFDQKAYNKTYYRKHRLKALADARAYVAANKERVAIYHKEYGTKNKATLNQYKQSWAAANPTKVVAARKKWTDANIEAMRELRRLWKKNHPVESRLHTELRIARKKNAAGACSAQQWKWRVEIFGGLCWMCHVPWEEIDHVKPLSKGGSSWPANLRPICGACNEKKGAKWPL